MDKIPERFNTYIELPGGGHADGWTEDGNEQELEVVTEDDADDESQGMTTKAEREDYAKFDESKHPRADDGKFGEGGGGGNERDNILDALEGHGFDRRDFDDPQENTLESLQELLDYETEQAGGEREAGAAAAESEEADHKAWKAREEGVSRVADAALSTAEAGGWSAPKGIYTAKSSSSRYVELQREGEYGAEYLNVRISDHVAPMGAGFNPESQEYNEPPDVDIIVGDDGTADLSVLQERVGGGTSKPKKSSPNSKTGSGGRRSWTSRASRW